MEIQAHTINNTQIAEIISDAIIIQDAEDALNLLGNAYYEGYDHMIIHQKNITPEFFDLKNKLAGEILQKFSTYRVRLTIICDISKFTSKSLNDFIYESNKGRHVNFVASRNDALKV